MIVKGYMDEEYYVDRDYMDCLMNACFSKKMNFGGEINSIYITKVIYNKPYTIAFWSDGTKTMSKCDVEDEYNPASGLAFCILKKVQGKEWVRNTLKDWLPDDTHNIIDLKYIRHRNKGNKKC